MVVHTGTEYGEILAKIYLHHPKIDPDQSTQKFLTSLKVDINDVWLVAVAITHNLIFVTDDDMQVIRDCVPGLRIENWLA